MRWWSRQKLHIQLIFVSGFLLAITLLVSTWININSQTKALHDDLLKSISFVGKNLSFSANYHIVTSEFDALEKLLLQSISLPELIEARILSPAGENLGMVVKDSTMPARLSFDMSLFEIPQTIQNNGTYTVNETNEVMITWHPVISDEIIGWIRLVADKSNIDALKEKIIVDNVLTAFMALILDILAMFLALSYHLSSFRKVINFSQELVEKPGEEFREPTGSHEIEELVDALNLSSQKLATQNKKIEQRENELVRLNHNLEIKIKERTCDLEISKEKLEFQATHDNLTGLPNRMLGLDRLNQAIIHAKRNHTKAALLFIDLDRFKIVNDSLGHEVGDQVLMLVAQRLKSIIRQEDTVVRLSGDEFLLILSDVKDASVLTSIASKVNQSLSACCKINNNEIHVGSSIGIAISPDHSNASDELLRYADAAMYKAKQDGRNTFKFYTSDMSEEADLRIQIESLLHHALANEEFSLNFQPIIDIRTKEIISAEALLRWNSPQLGFISPEKFIPITEETGLIAGLGNWVLMKACLATVEWEKFCGAKINISVNVSLSQLRMKNFADQVKYISVESGLSPQRLHLEITESILIEESEQISRNIDLLTQMGIRLSLDDFGTGYSSLSYLRRFPVSTLKIDKSFIQDINKSEESNSLIDAIVQIGKSLSLKVIAEGVETRKQFDYLLDQECDLVQGYLFSKPMTHEDFMKTLNDIPWKKNNIIQFGK